MARSAGVLFAISSLPSKYGIGCISKEAYDFVDFLKESGQSYWQILPLSATIHGEPADSPYKSYSAFAGNPYFIDLDELIGQGLLTKKECDSINWGRNPSKIDYDALAEHRLPLLRKAYERSHIAENAEYNHFVEENDWWLHDYALFMALKGFFGHDVPHQQWPEDIMKRWSYALDYYDRTLYYDIEFQKFMQFYFYKQWWRLRQYANDRNIKIIGDIPMYVAPDSVDVWAHPELFQLDNNHQPYQVAGAPPDNFSATGQLWGNPLYRWDAHRYNGYSWWMSRLYQNFRLYDTLRIDHFRAFDEYFAIPAGSDTAMNGHWEPGPGMDFFNTVNRSLGPRDILVEDLGLMTDSVRRLVRQTGFPNIKVLQFAFDPDDIGAANDYFPHNYGRNCIVYTGTHDNDTLTGWFKSLSDKEKALARFYCGNFDSPDNRMYLSFTQMALDCRANTAIIPIQDYLGLGSEARMNTPGESKGNWAWRIKPGKCDEGLKQHILLGTRISGRLNWENFDKKGNLKE